jgi:hypothetical protein
MVRTVLAIIAGLVMWMLVATILDIGLRHALPGYQAAEPVLAFTLAMKIARLALAVIASLAAGAAARVIAPASEAAPWIVGLVLVVLFVPTHIRIWSLLPIWYHLFFLITLAPFVVLGARLAPRGQIGRAKLSA